MAFNSIVHSAADATCDACRRDKGEIVVELFTRSRTEKDLVWIHPSCFQRIVDKAKEKVDAHRVK